MLISKYVHYVNLINVISLVGMSYWQIQDFNKFPTIIFPLFFGVFLLPMNNSLANKNKQILKVAAVMTMLALISLVYPSIQIFLKGDMHDVGRVLTMIFTSFVALIALLNCVKKTKDNLI